jgi:hypothetical protein
VNLDVRSPGVAGETSSHLVQGPRSVLHPRLPQGVRHASIKENPAREPGRAQVTNALCDLARMFSAWHLERMSEEVVRSSAGHGQHDEIVVDQVFTQRQRVKDLLEIN